MEFGTFHSRIMHYKKTVYICFVSFLIVCYSATIPVLTVFHNHDAQRGSSEVSIGRSATSANSTAHPPFCAICFRVSSAQVFIHLTINTDTDLIQHPAFIAKTSHRIDIIDLQSFQGRAPPLLLA